MISSNILKTFSVQNKKLAVVKYNIKTLKILTNRMKDSKQISKITKVKLFKNINPALNKSKLLNKTSKQNLISYIINVNLSLTNTLINITDSKGNTKKSFSAGHVKLTKTQKRLQPLALAKIFKFLLMKSWFLKQNPVALHFKNVRRFHLETIIKWLNDKMFIQSVQTFNFLPHNGCRPKKLRRFKRRTKRLVLKYQ